MEQLLEILSRVNSPELQERLLWIKIPFFVVTGFFISGVLVSLTRTPYIPLSTIGDAIELATYRPFGFPKMRGRWQKIMRRLDVDNESEHKLAIIEADALLDEMLKKMNLKGDNIDERLEKITKLMISNVEELKLAHQTRNSVVYDVDYRLSLQEARRVLLVYQRAFEDLDLFR
jgi:hypothetical protein